MASLRRTLSPVPRPGTPMSGEACQAPSPLSKSLSYGPNYAMSGGLLASVFGLSDSQTSVGTFSPRVSRQPERLKIKGQSWMRILFHLLICFAVGVFVGLTLFISMNSTTYLVSNRQAFSFDVVSTAGTLHTFEDINKNETVGVDVMKSTNLETDVHELLSVESSSKSNDSFVVQSVSNDVDSSFQRLLIIVTPTYTRPFQAYNLNRLAHTLKMVKPPLLWIVVEMACLSEQTADILKRTGIMYRHLVCNKNLTDVKDTSVHQRNVALQHIETHHLDGIVYFADDDNVYSLDLFKQMRQIRRFGAWTVAKQTESNVEAVLEGPVCNGTKVIGWHVNESVVRVRRFLVDMSGFAFNSTILWDPKRWHRPTIESIRQLDAGKDGFQISTFIEQVVEDESQMQGLPENCSTVMVWHLPLYSSNLNSFFPPKWFLNQNLDAIASFT